MAGGVLQNAFISLSTCFVVLYASSLEFSESCKAGESVVDGSCQKTVLGKSGDAMLQFKKQAGEVSLGAVDEDEREGSCKPYCADSRCWLSTPCRYEDKCVEKKSCSCNYKGSDGQQMYQTPKCKNAPTPAAPAVDMYKVEFDDPNARCNGAPPKGWGDLGTGLTSYKCKLACAGKPSCSFAAFHAKNGACTTFDVCDEPRSDNGKQFTVWSKTKPEGTVAEEAPAEEPSEEPEEEAEEAEAEPPKACEPICENAKKTPWERKCTWTETCDGCSICPTVCLSWCTDHSILWKAKCKWGQCTNCAPCGEDEDPDLD